MVEQNVWQQSQIPVVPGEIFRGSANQNLLFINEKKNPGTKKNLIPDSSWSLNPTNYIPSICIELAAVACGRVNALCLESMSAMSGTTDVNVGPRPLDRSALVPQSGGRGGGARGDTLRSGEGPHKH